MVDRFKCRVCGQITKDTDYYMKDRGLYLMLKRGGLCEECERVGISTDNAILHYTDYLVIHEIH